MYEEGGANQEHMTRLQIFLQKNILTWPLYTIVISFGQLLSAVRLPHLQIIVPQLTALIADLVPAEFARWYKHGSRGRLVHHFVHLLGIVRRMVHSFPNATVCLGALPALDPVSAISIPPSFLEISAKLLGRFAIAFTLIGFPSLHGIFTPHQKIIQRVAIWCYATASGAGFLFFGLNFGDEAGSSTEVWVTRACVVQGLQQIWVSALWFWGFTLNGTDPSKFQPPRAIMYITWPLALMSIIFAWFMFRGLPEYYHQVSRLSIIFPGSKG